MMHATKALQNGENPPEIYVSDGSMERNVNCDTMLLCVTFLRMVTFLFSSMLPERKR